MNQWVPLFQIFLSSPSPEVDASLYFQQQNNPNTSSFLSLLLTPANRDQQIYIQTLPFFVQSRILSFLTVESLRFCGHQLHTLAVHILSVKPLSSSDHPGFWVHRAARNLLTSLSPSEVSLSNPLQEKDEFHALPDWLQGHITTSTPFLSWLPVSHDQLLKTTDLNSLVFSGEPECEPMDIEQEEVDSCSPFAPSLDPQTCNIAASLKAAVLSSASTSEALSVSNGIRKLCLDSGFRNELALLSLIQPWQGGDETLSVLLSNWLGDGVLGSSNWPSCILCSVSLPKLLNLRTPASRVFLSATISFCKLHPVATVEALLFPLALHKEGINIAHCDFLTRVIKECLHKSHVSAFCQKLLCGKGKDRRLVCLPCHKDLISDELVWTEPMFTLLQHILTQDIYLTPDTVDQLVTVTVDMADKFSASLKFGNFFLCFVTKCTRAVNLSKVVLEKAAEKTKTFVTKSILSKLGGQ